MRSWWSAAGCGRVSTKACTTPSRAAWSLNFCPSSAPSASPSTPLTRSPEGCSRESTSCLTRRATAAASTTTLSTASATGSARTLTRWRVCEKRARRAGRPRAVRCRWRRRRFAGWRTTRRCVAARATRCCWAALRPRSSRRTSTPAPLGRCPHQWRLRGTRRGTWCARLRHPSPSTESRAPSSTWAEPHPAAAAVAPAAVAAAAITLAAAAAAAAMFWGAAVR
mmetsp:Transcript_37997/g.88929  ORF Transcript_37997/g.88929 Transcript_37997/m.88929 type:complete len:224 (-) Transcript_37997:2387-3058(-)